ncbi:MAG TPA: flagellar basal body L-ring protein FlgH, partial [Sphingomonadaceae bacterium]|nr:flagellar basal body L-ring protein FlgH [Sphingomonadaceae bacterium]
GSLIDLSSNSNSQGSGSVNRDEEIKLRVAALVTQVLPNGNLVIAGRQEVRVNYEVRDLQIAGLIRPEDITSTNTIKYDQIAEARIAYGGRGQISDVQQPRYGQQVFDIIWPF